jgi:hypothetical protein
MNGTVPATADKRWLGIPGVEGCDCQEEECSFHKAPEAGISHCLCFMMILRLLFEVLQSSERGARLPSKQRTAADHQRCARSFLDAKCY